MFVKPEEVIDTIDVRPGIKAADFGAGSGFYAIPLAKRVGPSGKVYAFDVRKEILEVIRSRARALGVGNIETIWTDLEKNKGSNLKDESIDLVIISNILFQLEDKHKLAAEAFRVLKQKGKVVLVEWTEEEKPIGPKLANRINRKDAEDIFVGAGFRFEKEFNPGEHHYGLILIKP